jgi:hypothetical protein
MVLIVQGLPTGEPNGSVASVFAVARWTVFAYVNVWWTVSQSGNSLLVAKCVTWWVAARATTSTSSRWVAPSRMASVSASMVASGPSESRVSRRSSGRSQRFP